MLASFGVTMLSGCGVARSVVERVRGCVDTAPPSSSGVRVVEQSVFITAHVDGPVGYAVIVPEGGKRPDAVVYLLPGRGGRASDLIGLGFAGFLAEHLRGGGRPFALAIMDAGESYFHPRASGEDRLAVATVEFPRIVRQVLGVATLREAIMGQSMGGYGALLAAEREPRRFRAVAACGPAIFPSYDDEHRSVGDAFDSASDYARYDVTAHAHALRSTPVHIAVGTRDPFLPGVRRFARACPTAQLVVTPGCHDDGFWRTSAPAAFAFLAERF
jgi:pimeloyl-ACP methyl ester carboxylesterase